MPRQNSTKISHLKSNPTSSILVKNNNTLFSSIKEGFGFGIGSTIARNMINFVSINSSNCIEYKKCLESNNKYECFGNLDKNEYLECKTIQ